MKASLLAISCYVAAVAAHGRIISPQPRGVGPAMAAACGQEAINKVNRDDTIPLENIKPATAACNLFLCRGATFIDNVNPVQRLSPGSVVDFKAEISIPHEGPCNVSIVDTTSNTVIGDPLIEFDTYADESLARLPANNTAFSITMPQLGANQCTEAGDCVLQWFWFGSRAQQTYENCVDFVMQ